MKKMLLPVVILLMLIFLFAVTGCQAVESAFSKASAAKTPAGVADEFPVKAAEESPAKTPAKMTKTTTADLSPNSRYPIGDGQVTINIALVGDIMVHDSQLKAGWDTRTGQYDFSEYFRDVTDYIQKADLAIGNLETTVAGSDRGYNGYPKFNSPEEIVSVVKNAGFDVVTNANNHSMDRGASGVVATIYQLDEAGLKHTGTASSLSDRAKYLLVDIKGIKVAILAYTYGTNGIAVPKGQAYLVNLINIPQIKEDIREVRALGADVVLVSPHFGTEYSRSPGVKEKELVEQIFKAGADIVAGSHPHVLQAMARRDPQREEGMFLAYSLGNFVSAQREQFRDSGIILNLTLQKDLATGKVTLSKAGYIPTWVQIGYRNGKKVYRVLAVEKGIRNYRQGTDPVLRRRDFERLRQVWEETTRMLSGQAAPDLQHV